MTIGVCTKDDLPKKSPLTTRLFPSQLTLGALLLLIQPSEPHGSARDLCRAKRVLNPEQDSVRWSGTKNPLTNRSDL